MQPTALIALGSLAVSSFALPFEVDILGGAEIVKSNKPVDLDVWDDNDGLPSAKVYNRGLHLGIMAHVGNPPQSMELLLDTGSDTTWLMSRDDEFCRAFKNKEGEIADREPGRLEKRRRTQKEKGSLNCELYGTYDSSNSSTALPSDFNTDKVDIVYYDSTHIRGDYYRENFTIGNNLTIGAFQFAVGRDTNSTFGVLGLGPPEGRIEKGKVRYKTYNFVRELQKAGKISRCIFSIWLNDKTSDTGSIFFGGIDKAKFVEPFLTMKMVQTKDKANTPPRHYDIVLSDIILHETHTNITTSIFNTSQSYQGKLLHAVIDSGTRMNYIPEEVLRTLVSHYERRFISKEGYYAIPCPHSWNDPSTVNDTIGFKFGTSTVSIPLRTFLEKFEFTQSSDELAQIRDVNGNRVDSSTDYCLLTMGPAKSERVIFGQSFMRTMYTVFDLDRMEVSLAPALYTPKTHFKKLAMAESLGGIADGIAPGTGDEYVFPDMYDPRRELMVNTNTGYYKYHDNAAGKMEVMPGILFVIVVMMCTTLLSNI